MGRLNDTVHVVDDPAHTPALDRCNLCFGRGYRPEVRRSGRGVYLRTCRRCGGTGSVEAGSRNPDAYVKKSRSPRL